MGIEHCYTIPNGSDPSMFRPDIEPAQGLGRRSQRLHVGWIGSHSNSIHNVDLITKLCHLVDEKGLPIDVHVIGRTRDMFVEPYPKCMVMHGPVSYFDLPKYLAGIDVGLVVYNIRYDEGSPLKLFDYLASGCVAICTPGDPMEDVLRGKEAGYMQEWSPESLAERLMTLRSDRALLDRMSTNGRKLIEQEHNWTSIAEKTDRIIREAVDRQRS